MVETLKIAADAAWQIVVDADGELVGRTRIQKIAYLLEAAGLGSGFYFDYKHYGPFSDELGSALKLASMFNLIEEEERPTSWGGFYSIFRSSEEGGKSENLNRIRLIEMGKSANAVELELAATAAFLALEGSLNPWVDTAKLKSDKTSDGRLDRAKKLYRQFLNVDTPQPLPAI